MTILVGFQGFTHRFARMTSLVGLAGLLALAFAIVGDVLCRWLLDSPITGVRDAGSLFVAVVIASSLPTCAAERRHIAARFLGKVLGPRWNAGLEIFGNLVTLALFSLLAWHLWVYTDLLIVEKESTLLLGWPVWPWWRVVTVIVGLCVPIQMVVLLELIKSVLSETGEPIEKNL